MPAWLIPAITTAAGLIQGLSGNRQESRNRDLQREQMLEGRRQFDTRHRLDTQRYGLDERQVAMNEGIDRRRSTGLEATSGTRQQLIASILRRLGMASTGGSL